jgi:hypothetical protein
MSYDFTVRSPEPRHAEYDKNVTYNVSSMLKRAGFHPNVVDGMTAVNLRPIVSNAVCVIEDNREYFAQFNPSNGWGDLDGVLEFLVELSLYLNDAPDEYVMSVT